MLHCLQLQFAPRGTIPHENYGDGSSPRLWVEIADFSLTLGVQRKSKGILKECCHTALQQIARGGGGVLNKILLSEAPPVGPSLHNV